MRERGSILFLILLVIILFAALTYAVNSGMQSGGKDVSDEQAKAYAAAMIDQATTLENNLQRFLVTSGYTIDQIDMNLSGITTGGDNPNCTTNACNLFSASGGNISISMAPKEWRDLNATVYFPTGTEDMPPNMAAQVVTNIGTSLPDVIFVYYGVNQKVCKWVNIIMGLRAATDPIISVGGSYYQFGSVMGGSTPLNPFTPPIAARTWCHERSSATNTFGAYFHHILVAR